MNLIDNRNEEQMRELDLELLELQRTIEDMDQKNQDIIRKEKDLKNIKKIKLNYGKKERKYNYDKIKEIEKNEKGNKKVKAKIAIDKNWEIANMKDPDMNYFFKSKKTYSYNLEDDFKEDIKKNEILFENEEKNIFTKNILDSEMESYFEKFEN